MILIHLSLALASSSFAAIPLFPKLFQEKQPNRQQSLRSHDGYADFSGHWTGVCDNDPEEKISLTIEQSSDFSSITFDNEQMPIDTISAYSTQGNFVVDKNIAHLHWSGDGQQLLGSLLAYRKEGNLALDGIEVGVGKFSWSLENDQLHYSIALSFFKDGTLTNTTSYHCVYNKASIDT